MSSTDSSKNDGNNSGSDNSNWRSCFRNDLFVNQVGLISGGGSGIGEVIATELASLGAIVVIASRDHNKCNETAQKINASRIVKAGGGGGKKGYVVAGPSTNIRKEDDIVALISFVVRKFGKINFLVNNAGGQFLSSAEDISRRGFNAVMETNLLGTFLMCREAYNQYMSEHGGNIINITLGNRNGMPMMMHSGAARAGIENMTKSLCTEWIESGVRINCVRPGIIWTDSGAKNYGPAVEMFAERIIPSIPAKRLGTPQEISSAVTWLLCEGASYVTGTTLCVDGGSSYTFLPLIDIDEKQHLSHYGSLPKIARL